MRRRVGLAAAVIVPLLALGGLVLLITRGGNPLAPRTYPAPPAGKPVHATLPVRKYLGVYEPGAPESYAPVAKFSQATRVNPDIVLYYSSWWKPFQVRFADQAHAHDATPFVQMIPSGKGVSISRLINGQYDNYIKTFAGEVRDWRYPVIISFAPEADGYWYQWGWTRIPASEWVRAWKHVVNDFRAEGAGNVIWLWTMNRSTATSRRVGPFRDYWPGKHYVNWVGIDGYYDNRAEDFNVVFGWSIGQIQKFTHAPILISETAVGPAAGPSKIPQLFAGVRKWNLLGLVWFDKDQHHPPVRQDWRVEDSPAALAAFRKAAQGYVR
jgi:mannan endo-1,4-beta-mannosidase